MAAATLPDLHLQIRIDLWLAELYRECGRHGAAAEALGRAEARLRAGGREQGWLRRWLEQLREPAARGSTPGA